MRTRKTNILFAASECVPFIKTGGLADVAGSLPKYFNKKKYDVRVMLPKYACIPEKYRSEMKEIARFVTGFNFRDLSVGVEELILNEVHFYFISNDFFFSGSWPYGTVYDDIEKFAFYSKMVLSALKQIDWKPDILHCHDWQTALVPVYLNDSFQGDLYFHNMKTVFTIHNLKFQGTWDVKTVMAKTGLSEYYFTPDKLEAWNNGNMLKGGLVYSDRVTTVSETYAKEIQTPYYGEGLDGLLRALSGSLTGIVNGIDTDFYNPETDSAIPVNYGIQDAVTKKAENKLMLQKKLGLKEDPDAFLVGIVSRLTDQKGFDLVDCVMSDLVNTGAQFVILGTGEARYENMFRYYASAYPGRVAAEIYYSEPLSHEIYAASDAFLMPSLFEPCGLSQLMALRYGSLPIVRETGGLKDTVLPYNEYEKTGTGFSFANYNAHEMLSIVRYAARIFKEHREDWNDMVIRAMSADFSWNASARKYEALYDGLMAEKKREETPKGKKNDEA